MAIARAAIAVLAAAVLGFALVSGGSDADPRTPPALPGLPPPFLGTTLTGIGGGMTASLDAYGDVVDLRNAPAGPPLIDNSAARQAAGTVPADTGIVPLVSLDGGPAEPMWRADSVSQRYEPGTNVVRTVAEFGEVRVVMRTAASFVPLVMTVAARGPGSDGVRLSASVNVQGTARCESSLRKDGDLELNCGARRTAAAPLYVWFEGAEGSARYRLEKVRPLGPGAPPWARHMYRRSLLVLFGLLGENGALAAGTRDGWAYVWPRDAATAALAFEAAGLQQYARRIARFLGKLPLARGARFREFGGVVPGRGPQGDELGWVLAAYRGAGLEPPAALRQRGAAAAPRGPLGWRDLPDYQEGGPGDYLGNALAASYAAAALDGAAAAGAPGVDGPKTADIGGFSAHRPRLSAFEARGGLVREADDPASGLDSAAAWAVRPFAAPALYPAARRTLFRLARQGTRFGITPGEGWSGGEDPWTAPTAAAAWALAALGDRRAALRLIADLRRAATPTGLLPERVDAKTGIPRSTTPLAWSHAYAILALHQLWP